jgi:hypothetical protein
MRQKIKIFLKINFHSMAEPSFEEKDEKRDECRKIIWKRLYASSLRPNSFSKTKFFGVEDG